MNDMFHVIHKATGLRVAYEYTLEEAELYCGDSPESAYWFMPVYTPETWVTPPFYQE